MTAAGRIRRWIRALGAALVMAMATQAGADTLDLSGILTDGRGQPLAGQTFRLVLGSDPLSRARDAGRAVTTDAQGRFALRTDVTLRARRIRLDQPRGQHDSRLLELGFEFDLLGQPALYWAEIDFTRFGPLTGLQAFVAQADGFIVPLTFHDREFAWSIPGDPNGLRLSSMGAEVEVLEANTGEDGVWRLDLAVEHQRFEMH